MIRGEELRPPKKYVCKCIMDEAVKEKSLLNIYYRRGIHISSIFRIHIPLFTQPVKLGDPPSLICSYKTTIVDE